MITLLTTFWAMLLGKEGANARKAAFVILALVFGLLLLVSIGIYRFFAPSKLENQIEDRKPEIVNAQVNSAVATEQTNQAQSKVEQSTKTSQSASKRTQEAIHKDSNQYANDNSGQRFCDRFPEDSTCQK